MHRSEDSVHEPWLWQSSNDHHPPRDRDGRPVHLLEPPFGDPIPLPAASGETLVVGRDPGCNIRISSPTVSRRHAEIRFRGTPPRAYLNDLGTKNGTRLSGAPVRGERTLDSGDVIRFGDVTAIYRIVREGESSLRPAPAPEPPPDTTTGIGLAPIPGGLSGDARLVPLDGLLGRLTIVRASGRLEVEVDGAAGYLVLEEGSIVEANFGGRDGSVAIRAIAALRRGRFHYHEDGVHEALGITPARGTGAPGDERGATFVREGATWILSLPRSSAVRVAHVRGLAMIERLLARPGVEIDAFELAHVDSLPPKAPGRGDRVVEQRSGVAARRRPNGAVGSPSDARARREYEARARELRDLVSAGVAGPRIVDELVTLERHLRSAANSTPSETERARSSVTHAVRRALALVGEAEVAAGIPATPVARHLQEAIATGARLVYRRMAGAPEAWRLTGGIVVAPPRDGRGRQKSQP